MADVDVEPETVIAEETAEPKSVNIDAMGGDELVQKEIELQRKKSNTGRFAYNEAKELATIQRRLYGSPKINMPKKPMTPFEYSKNVERYTPIVPRNRAGSRFYNMEVRGKTQLEVVKRGDRNTKRKHRLRSDKRNVFDETIRQSPMLKKKKKKRRRKKSKKDKDEEDK